MARSTFDLTLCITIIEVLKSTQINMIFSYKNYNNKRHLKPLLFSDFFVKPRVKKSFLFSVAKRKTNDGDHDDDNDENAVSVIISCMKMQLVSRL